jgi:predicted GNAT family acetyltransferase
VNDVHHDATARRFSTEVEGQRAVLDYRLSNNVMTITHTGVPAKIGDRGIAGELVQAALDTARAEGWEVVAACSYAAAYMAKHALADEAPADRKHGEDLLDEALDESFPASDPPSVGNSS